MAGGPGEKGQASAEFAAVLPGVLLAVFLLAQLLVAGYALWSAGIAARAGARADHVGKAAAPVALAALPELLREGAEIEDGDGVRVRVRVPALIPGVRLPPVEAGTSLEAAVGDG